jgi:hypothetical protein
MAESKLPMIRTRVDPAVYEALKANAAKRKLGTSSKASVYALVKKILNYAASPNPDGCVPLDFWSLD